MSSAKSLLTGFLGLCALGLSSCGSPAPPVEPSPEPPRPKAPTLFDALRDLERVGPPQQALPSWAEEATQALLTGLSETERSDLALGTHPLSAAHPLLHWTAGGNSLEVAAAAVFTPALVDEWSALASDADPAPSRADLVSVGNALVRRAALHLLRERAADFAPGRAPAPEAVSEVARAAALLELEPVTSLALDTWTSVQPDDPALLELSAERAARALDVASAKAALARIPDEPHTVEVRNRLAPLIEAAVRVTAADHDPVVRARDYTTLGRHDLALGALDRAAPGLKRATETARARFEGGMCPGVLRPNVALCRAAFGERANAIALGALLEQAWAGGAGRDALSIEHYLGLRFVARLMYRVSDQGGALQPAALAEVLGELATRAEEAAAVEGRFAALGLLSRSLLAALRANSGPPGAARAEIPPAQRADLRAEARRLVTSAPGDWTTKAALCALALSLQDDPLGPDLDAIGSGIGPTPPPTWSALELWTALADRDVARLDAAKARLVDVLESASESERAGWLLAFAEAEAVLRSGANAGDTLQQLAARLQAPGTPLELRLRAHLDAAGGLARAGNTEGAIAALDAALAAVPDDGALSPATTDAWILVSGYREVVRARREGELQAARDALSALLERVATAGRGSPSILTWLELWHGELRTRAALDACGRNAACRTKAGAKDDPPRRSRLAAVLGDRTALLFGVGVVPLGGAELDIGYDGHAIRPRVGLQLAFPLVEVPALD